MTDVDSLAKALAVLSREGGATPERTRSIVGPFRLTVVDALIELDGDDGNIERYLVGLAVGLITDEAHRTAVHNALGLAQDDDHASTLTERRAVLLRTSDRSPRTLIRHEREGALALARILVELEQQQLVPMPVQTVRDIQDDEARAEGLEQAMTILAEACASARVDLRPVLRRLRKLEQFQDAVKAAELTWDWTPNRRAASDAPALELVAVPDQDVDS